MRVFTVFSSAAPYPLKLISYFFWLASPPLPRQISPARAQLVKKEPLLNTFLGIQAKTPL